ncbi:MAG: metal ABC transporter ATP-binding protein [Sphaerochaetaceae bacterium]|nr:metal ABC transporter ATP-binding protein [Sphaerochaetaceae bacterium]MDC7238349.1 metal ABC transporter ATP-binding protein [Sphaerochaetaceae bacterium]MDC7250514.1 metal ABC transporter ATP-binding protein [Sphaerochaetaceae bacterium]
MSNALEVQNLSVKYNNNYALKNITMSVEEGDYLGIIGPNGGGKTSLLRAILNLIDHDCSKILFFDKPFKQVQKLISYVPQISKVDRSYPISVLEVVIGSKLKKSLNPFYKFSKEDKESARDALKMVNIENLADRQIEKLSGGEFQRLLIARALASSPKLLLLDEPTANVDPASRNIIYNLLDKLNNEGTTIIMVSHDTMAISSKVKNIACISENLIYHGGPHLSQQVIDKMYGCPIDLLAHGVPHRVLAEHKH